MRVKAPLTISNLTTLEDVTRYASITFDAILGVLNGKVGLTDNCETSLVSVVFSGSGVTVTVPHTLRHTPVGYIVTNRTTGITVFNGSTAHNSDNLYVQASGAGTVGLLVF